MDFRFHEELLVVRVFPEVPPNILRWIYTYDNSLMAFKYGPTLTLFRLGDTLGKITYS